MRFLHQPKMSNLEAHWKRLIGGLIGSLFFHVFSRFEAQSANRNRVRPTIAEHRVTASKHNQINTTCTPNLLLQLPPPRLATPSGPPSRPALKLPLTNTIQTQQCQCGWDEHVLQLQMGRHNG